MTNKKGGGQTQTLSSMVRSVSWVQYTNTEQAPSTLYFHHPSAKLKKKRHNAVSSCVRIDWSTISWSIIDTPWSHISQDEWRKKDSDSFVFIYADVFFRTWGWKTHKSETHVYYLYNCHCLFVLVMLTAVWNPRCWELNLSIRQTHCQTLVSKRWTEVHCSCCVSQLTFSIIPQEQSLSSLCAPPPSPHTLV